MFMDENPVVINGSTFKEGRAGRAGFFRATSDVASISFTLQLKCITQVTKIFRKV